MIKLHRPLDVIVMEASNALDIAEAIAKVAFECRGDVVPQSALKVDVAERAAKVLVPRVENVLRSTRDKQDRYRAETIVATCLSEVL